MTSKGLVIQKILDKKIKGIRVEFNHNFLNSGYGRKVYIVETGFTMRIPEHKAHAHSSPHWLIPLIGKIRIAYKVKKDLIALPLELVLDHADG